MGLWCRTLAISLLLTLASAYGQLFPFGFWKSAGGGSTGSGVYSGSVQSADFSIDAWNANAYYSITGIDSARTFVLASYYANVDQSKFTLTEPILHKRDSLHFQRGDGGDNYTVYGRYYVVSDTGITFQRVQRTVENDSLTMRSPLTAVDTTKSFVVLSAQGAGSSAWYDFHYWQPYLHQDSITFRRYANGDNLFVVSAQIVTYDSCTVQQKVVSFHADSLEKNVTISAADLAKTFVLVYATGQYFTNMFEANVYSELTNTTNLRLTRTGGGSILDVTAYVVTFTDGSTVQAGEVNLPDAETLADTTVSTIALDRTFLVGNGTYLCGGKTAATGANQAQAQTKISFADATTVQAERFESGSQTGVRFYAVTLGGLK
jgi:hypothetical protein